MVNGESGVRVTTRGRAGDIFDRFAYVLYIALIMPRPYRAPAVRERGRP